ncbi:PREDICTED: uncharacterized protein LOC108778227 [Cyphomyrmex costatus]|uniref:uncharacterized protein LOC108778227 n=1 Tax=Cyphomyrmex costatus TaxID=456900 RepID=UPI00085225E0|nr:PREDICTED: uncharacterized protein LOC108778227 [Cyphomyrmex costatus]
MNSLQLRVALQNIPCDTIGVYAANDLRFEVNLLLLSLILTTIQYDLEHIGSLFNMPRYKYGSKKKPAIDVDAMVAAMKEVMNDKKLQCSVAKAYNINDTKLHRYISDLKSKNIDPATATNEQLTDFVTTKCNVTGGRTVFSVDQEKELMKYLLHSTAMYYGLTICELVTMAYEFAKKSGVRYPPEWDVHCKASKDWYYAFMHRHLNLSLRTPEQTSANRAKAFCAENVNAFFTNLHVAMFQSGIRYDPDRIWNMDETGCPTVPTKTVKVIAEKVKKRVGQKTSAERGTNVTLALAVNVAGQSIHPFFIFPKKNMQSSWMVKASPGTVGVANESGWMDSKTFVKYLGHFIKHAHASKSSPTLLLLDSHTSHLSIEVIDMAIDAGITMLSFPPHCTHRMQPLDVTIFGPFKTMFSRQCQNWMKSHSSLQFYHIVTIAEQCLDACATRKNIKNGFQVTGICEYNPDVFTAEDFVAAELSGENETIENEGDNQRVLMVSGDVIETVAHEEVTTSASEIASTSGASSMPSTSGASIRRALKEQQRTDQPMEEENLEEEQIRPKRSYKRLTPLDEDEEEEPADDAQMPS